MKIISKHKDYYDYLQGIYGIDNRIVFDRRWTAPKMDLEYGKDDPIEYLFHICNRKYRVKAYKGNLYHTFEEMKVLDKLTAKKDKRFVRKWYRRHYPEDGYSKEHWQLSNGPSEMNIKLREPILVSKSIDIYARHKTLTKEVILSEFKFAKWLPAETLFSEISMFMGYLKDHPEIPNKQTDKEKLDSHGFDKVKSFRHRKL